MQDDRIKGLIRCVSSLHVERDYLSVSTFETDPSLSTGISTAENLHLSELATCY